MKRKTIFLVTTLVVIALAAGAAWFLWPKPEPIAKPPVNQQITVEGKIGCLPPKGTGPHIDICSIGLKTSTGEYYGLNMNGHDPQYKYSQGGLPVRVTGRLTAATPTSFTSVGTIVVSDIQTTQ